MANEIFKEIKTKIALKTLDLAGWEAIKETYKPLKGEVCVCEIPTGKNVPTANSVTPPTVLFKVGDGVNFWKDLNWASALAADVYSWAKEPSLFVHKDGTGNVVSGIEWDAALNDGKGGVKYTTAAVATAEGLEDLQEAVAAIEKDITDNRGAWNKYEDTRYSFSTDGDKLVVKKTLYTNGVAGAEEAVGTYEFLTAAEVAETLKGYYTKGEVDTKLGDYALKSELHSPTVITDTYGITVTDGGDRNYTISHGNTSDVANLVADGRKYVTGLTFDEFGHVSAYTTGSETVTDTTYKLDTDSSYAANYRDFLKSTDGGKTWTSASEMGFDVGIIDVGSDSDEITIADDGDGAGKLVVSFDRSGIDQSIADALAEAKKYADDNDANDNTAHTHVSGKGIKVDNAGGISGEVKADLNVAFELVDKTIKLYDRDDATKTAIATLDATEFIADGMLASVTADQTNNKLVFEWNTDAGVTKTEIPLSSIADIYTGKTGDEVNVVVSNTNEISASLNSAVATKIGHGEEAYNWGNHANAGYAIAANLGDLANKDNITHEYVTDFDTEVAKIKVNTAADAEKLGGQAPSYYATATSVTDITKTNGTIDTKISTYDATLGALAKKDNITHDLVTDFDAEVAKIKVNSAVDADKLGGTAAANYLLKSDAAGYNDILTAGDAAGLYQPLSETLTAFNNAWTINDGTLRRDGGNIITGSYHAENATTSAIYSPTGISYDGNGDQSGSISFPNLGSHGYFVTINDDGIIGNKNNSDAKDGGIARISVGYHDNGVDINGNGTITLYSEMDSTDGSSGMWISSLSITHDGFVEHTGEGKSCEVSLPHVSGELVVSGSEEIVYVLNCN